MLRTTVLPPAHHSSSGFSFDFICMHQMTEVHAKPDPNDLKKIHLMCLCFKVKKNTLNNSSTTTKGKKWFAIIKRCVLLQINQKRSWSNREYKSITFCRFRFFPWEQSCCSIHSDRRPPAVTVSEKSSLIITT